MTFSFSYYETLVFIHRHLVEIISFLSLGVIVMAIILIVNSYHKRKANISARKMQAYKIFSPQEWDIFIKKYPKMPLKASSKLMMCRPKAMISKRNFVAHGVILMIRGDTISQTEADSLS